MLTRDRGSARARQTSRGSRSLHPPLSGGSEPGSNLARVGRECWVVDFISVVIVEVAEGEARVVMPRDLLRELLPGADGVVIQSEATH